MDIKTKFSLGQEVWYRVSSHIVNSYVQSIAIGNDGAISYGLYPSMAGFTLMPAASIFETRSEVEAEFQAVKDAQAAANI